MRGRNQDHLRPAPIGKSRLLNATSESLSDFVFSEIRTEGAIRVRKPATDIALETGTARHKLWQRDWWCHNITHQLIGVCRQGMIPLRYASHTSTVRQESQGMSLS